MNGPLITWICIVAVFILALIMRMHSTMAQHQHRHPAHHKIFEIGSEWEEIYLPGDKRIKNDYDYDEFDD